MKAEHTDAGDRLLAGLTALANPHRIRVLAALHERGEGHVSRLARTIGISRPLMHLHLRKLAEAGLVTSRHELSSDGKALAIYTIEPFELSLTPAALAKAAATLSPASQDVPETKPSNPKRGA